MDERVRAAAPEDEDLEDAEERGPPSTEALLFQPIEELCAEEDPANQLTE